MLPIEIISKNIATNKTLCNKKKYLITREVHVRPGACLKIQDGVEILLLNGEIKSRGLNRAALIFDQGSKLQAKKMSFRAASIDGKYQKNANNGGIWFLGNHKTASKDSVSVQHNPRKRKSWFRAIEIKTYYLGTKDTVRKKNKKQKDDIDGISILGTGRDEWNITTIKSNYSGDDGLDLTNSDIKVDKLYIRNPSEDGLNISSSRIEIVKNLTITIDSSGSDRDLFDLETDDGGSFIEICRGCRINFNGIFGDQLVLSSSSLPKISQSRLRRYNFIGVIKKTDALIYSITKD